MRIHAPTNTQRVRKHAMQELRVSKTGSVVVSNITTLSYGEAEAYVPVPVVWLVPVPVRRPAVPGIVPVRTTAHNTPRLLCLRVSKY